MRLLLVLAATFVAALIWPRGETRHVCRAPAAGARVALPVGGSTMDGAATATSPGSGGTPGAERGRCVLRLRLLDETSGKPFASDVELWRLDLPEDERWTAGDQLETTRNVGPDGYTFANLPAGRYRPVVCEQSFLADGDPPAFLVRGAVTDRDLAVRVPRWHRVCLQVFDERGRELRTARIRHHSWSWYSDGPMEPAWALRRRPKHASAGLHRSIVVGGGIGGGGSLPYREATWTEAGFDLGRCREDTRGRRSSEPRSLLLPGHTAVIVDVNGRLSADRTYVAVSVSLEELKDYVFLPDGRRAADAGALFEARSDAVERKPSLPPDAWRSLPVHVRVGLGGHELLTFEYRVDRPPAPQVMRPRIHG